MPTYELTCEGCGEQHERFLMRLIREEDKVCPECGSHDVHTGIGGGILGVGTSTEVSVAASCGRSGFT